MVGQKVVDLYFELSNCGRYDWCSQSDPYVEVWTIDGNDEKGGRKIGSTETIQNNHNPRWATPVRTRFFGEEGPTLRIYVFDEDDKARQDSDYIGSCIVNLFKLYKVFSGKQELILTKCGHIVKSNVNGITTSLLVRLEEVRENLGVLKLRVSGHGLAAVNCKGLTTSNPYVELLKPLNDNSLLTVARTETVYRNLNPVSKTMTIELSRLRNGEPYSLIKLRCMAEKTTEDPVLIGDAQVSVKDILRSTLSGDNVDVKLENRNSPLCLHGVWKQDPGIIRLSDAKILPSVGGMSQKEVCQLLVSRYFTSD